MGGGGGGSYSNWEPKSLAREVREDLDRSAEQFESHLSGVLSALLAGYNTRDEVLVRQRLNEAKGILQDEIDQSIDHLFGGSVAKHTYVDGLSDIDSLLILNGTKFEDLAPPKILEKMDARLRNGLGDSATVTHGRMAATIAYPDAMSLQLLPAIMTENGIKVPASRGEGWSEINPEKFQSALSKRNGECGAKLVPTIKLAKAVIANLPEAYRLTGYHVESIAISAFRDYEGRKTTAAMLPVFFEKAKDIVLAPIRDKTGQSVHVDAYLGETNSPERVSVSHLFGRIAKRMKNASAAKSEEQWRELFFSEE